MSILSMGEMGKDFCPNSLQPFLETIDRRTCKDGSRELIPVFQNSHRKGRPSLLQVPCRGAPLSKLEVKGCIETFELVDERVSTSKFNKAPLSGYLALTPLRHTIMSVFFAYLLIPQSHLAPSIVLDTLSNTYFERTLAICDVGHLKVHLRRDLNPEPSV